SLTFGGTDPCVTHHQKQEFRARPTESLAQAEQETPPSSSRCSRCWSNANSPRFAAVNLRILRGRRPMPRRAPLLASPALTSTQYARLMGDNTKPVQLRGARKKHSSPSHSSSVVAISLNVAFAAGLTPRAAHRLLRHTFDFVSPVEKTPPQVRVAWESNSYSPTGPSWLWAPISRVGMFKGPSMHLPTRPAAAAAAAALALDPRRSLELGQDSSRSRSPPMCTQTRVDLTSAPFSCRAALEAAFGRGLGMRDPCSSS
ncbi:hypothetical protein CMUS01_14333, partial [Colletotrichum musicola]